MTTSSHALPTTPPRIAPVSILIACVLMVGAIGLADLLRPHKYWADVIGEPHYETLVPKRFGDWEMLPYKPTMVVNPVQEENLLRLYTETYAQTFVHKPTGRMLMLSIAYGRDQTNDAQIHVPEACYPSQGFKVESHDLHDVPTAFGDIASIRMLTTQGSVRTEPLTYFIRVGDSVARGSKERNLRRLSMAIRGYRIDGMLFRVSELTRSKDAFDLQDRFIADFLGALTPQARERFIGKR